MLLELKNASLSLHGKPLFTNLSMMAQGGQMTCITGPHGAGKTALLRVLMGFLPLDDGLVSLDGELLTPLSATTFRRFMAYVPQPELSGVASKPCGVGTASALRPRQRGLETVFAPATPFASHPRRQKTGDSDDWPWDRPTAADTCPPPCEQALKQAPVILADDPAPPLLPRLKALAAEGRTVVVATQREEYINLSDKTIILGNNDHHLR